jgi:hypothetical protein
MPPSRSSPRTRNSDRLDGTAFVFNRLRIGIKRQIDDGIVVVMQMQDSRIWGQEGSSLTPLNNIDLHQAYLQLSAIAGLPVSLRVGRQELSFGGERLVGAYDWDNVGRAFDAARLSIGHGDHRLDLWLAQVRDHNAPTVARNQEFAGAYLSVTASGSTRVEGYALLLTDRRNFNFGPGPQKPLNVYTFGVRVARPPLLRLDYDFEVAYQTGSRGLLDIRAYGLALDAGYTFNTFGSPRIRAAYVFGSGDDDPNDAVSGTFSNLFPDAHSNLGFMDYASWSNISAVRLGAEWSPTTALTVGVDFHLLALAEGDDAWYRAGGFNIGSPPEFYRRAVPGTNRSLGREVDLRLAYRYRPGVYLSLGFGQFFVGRFIDATGGGRADDSSWGYLSLAAEF